jgi:hypothetical protein
MDHAPADQAHNLLFSLPSDLLPFIFSFLSPKELCCLDSAALNHTSRQVFLSALIKQFQNGEFNFGDSFFIGVPHKNVEFQTRWYLCRRIPLSKIFFRKISCPTEIISMNLNSLKEINLGEITLASEDALALTHCSHLKILSISRCLFPVNHDLSSFLKNLTSLEVLSLSHVRFSKLIAQTISQHCRSLKSIQFDSLNIGDDELRILAEGCSSLRSLRLSSLDNLTDEAIKMLMNHRPQIPSVAVCSCEGVSEDILLSLLREITIPAIFNEGDEDLQICALKDLSDSIPYFSDEDDDNELFVSNLLTHDSLSQRLVALLRLRNRMHLSLISFFQTIVGNGYPHLVVDMAVVPVLVHQYETFNLSEMTHLLRLLKVLSSQPSCQEHLLTSGVLSIFRPHLPRCLKVSET